MRGVDVHGHGATADDGFRRREERVRDGSDLVSGSYVEHFERQFDGHRAVGERHRVLDAEKVANSSSNAEVWAR